MARRRRRRPGDSADGLEELEDDDDLDIRIQSVEEELQNLSLSAAVAARDAVTMKNKIEKLARELEDDGGDDEIFHEIDAAKAGVTALSEHVELRLDQLQQRLQDVGGRGSLEEFAGRLEQDLSAALEQALKSLEDPLIERLQLGEAAVEQAAEEQAGRQEELRESTEAALLAVRDDQARLLTRVPELIREQLISVVGDFNVRLETLTTELEASFADIEGTFQTTLEATQSEGHQNLENLRNHFDATLAEVAEGLDSRAGSDQIEALQGELRELKQSFGNATELAERARQATARINDLEKAAGEQTERVLKIIKQSEEAARQVEQHSEKVNLAVKLVNQLEERARGGLAGGVSAGGGESDLDAPEKTELGFELKDLLQVMVHHEASDLHLKAGSAPTVRLNGELIPVGDHVLAEEDCRRLVFSALSRPQRRRLVDNKALAFTYEMGGHRFKACGFVQRGGYSASFKAVSKSLSSAEELGLPAVIKKIVATSTRGLILVAGPTGSGKSTTLNALVDLLNQNRKMHIVTLEQPIGYYHEDAQSLITQREVGIDTPSFLRGIREAVYQDPDVVVVDRVEDSETLGALLDIADGSRLVLAAIDARTSVHAVRRLLELEQQRPNQNSTAQVAASLRVVLGQRLLQRSDGKGLVAAFEVLVNTPTVTQAILKGRVRDLPNLLETGTAEGQQSLSQSLQRLVDAGLVTRESVALYGNENQSAAALSEAPPLPAAPKSVGVPIADGVLPTLPSSDDTLMNWL